MYDLTGLLTINGKDVWTEFGAFLAEEKRGGRENLTAILAPAKAKGHVGVDFRERNGTGYSGKLETRSEERDVTLQFALHAGTRREWLDRYRAFIAFLKRGEDGWLLMRFPGLGLTMRVFYVECTSYKPLTSLWEEGAQAGRFKVRFKEPEPSF